MLNGIKVEARDIQTWEVLDWTFTGAKGKDGEYELTVPTDRLLATYIELYYNALDYATVSAVTWERYGVAGQIKAPEGKQDGDYILDDYGHKILRKNSSKAFEDVDRRGKINSVYFNSIEKGEESQNGINDRTTGITKDEYGNQKGTLKYDLNNNVAKLTNISSLDELEIIEHGDWNKSKDITEVWARIGLEGKVNCRIFSNK